MRRLNKTEVRALAEKIYSEAFPPLKESTKNKVKTKMEKTWDKFKNSKDFSVLQKYGVSASLRTIVKDDIVEGGYLFSLSYYNNKKRTGFFRVYGGIVNIYRDYDEESLSINTIEREIVLAQIGGNDIDSIINTVKKELSI